MARGSQIGTGRARAEAGEPSGAGIDGANPPAPEADRPSGRRAAWQKECSTLRTAAAWVITWSGGCGAGARASNRVPRTSYGSVPSKLSVGGGAPWTSTALRGRERLLGRHAVGWRAARARRGPAWAPGSRARHGRGPRVQRVRHRRADAATRARVGRAQGRVGLREGPCSEHVSSSWQDTPPAQGGGLGSPL